MNYRALLLITLPLILEACSCGLFEKHETTETYHSLNGISISGNGGHIFSNGLSFYIEDFPINNNTIEVDKSTIGHQNFESINFIISYITETSNVYVTNFGFIQSALACDPIDHIDHLNDEISSIQVSSIPVWDTLAPNAKDLTEIILVNNTTISSKIESGVTQYGLSDSFTLKELPNSDSLQLAFTYTTLEGNTFSDTTDLIIFK